MKCLTLITTISCFAFLGTNAFANAGPATEYPFNCKLSETSIDSLGKAGGTVTVLELPNVKLDRPLVVSLTPEESGAQDGVDFVSKKLEVRTLHDQPVKLHARGVVTGESVYLLHLIVEIGKTKLRSGDYLPCGVDYVGEEKKVAPSKANEEDMDESKGDVGTAATAQ